MCRRLCSSSAQPAAPKPSPLPRGVAYSFFDILPTAGSRGIPPPSLVGVPGSSVTAFPGFHSGLVLRGLPRQLHRLPGGGRAQPFSQDVSGGIGIAVVVRLTRLTDPRPLIEVKRFQQPATR